MAPIQTTALRCIHSTALRRISRHPINNTAPLGSRAGLGSQALGMQLVQHFHRLGPGALLAVDVDQDVEGDLRLTGEGT